MMDYFIRIKTLEDAREAVKILQAMNPKLRTNGYINRLIKDEYNFNEVINMFPSRGIKSSTGGGTIHMFIQEYHHKCSTELKVLPIVDEC